MMSTIVTKIVFSCRLPMSQIILLTVVARKAVETPFEFISFQMVVLLRINFSEYTIPDFRNAILK